MLLTVVVAFRIVLPLNVLEPAKVLFPVKAMLAVLSKPGVLKVVLVGPFVMVMPELATNVFHVGVLPLAERNWFAVGEVEVPKPPCDTGSVPVAMATFGAWVSTPVP